MQGEWSCYRDCQFNGGRMMLQRWRMEGEWSCYRYGYFNGSSMVMLQEVASLMEVEWSCYRTV